jgi:hypothetical protein
VIYSYAVEQGKDWRYVRRVFEDERDRLMAPLLNRQSRSCDCIGLKLTPQARIYTVRIECGDGPQVQSTCSSSVDPQ